MLWPGKPARCSSTCFLTRNGRCGSVVLIHSVCGSISRTSKSSGWRSIKGSIAPEYVAPIPSARVSGHPAKASDSSFFVKSQRVDFSAEENVEPRTARLATQLTQHISDGFVQEIDITVDLVRDGYGDRSSGRDETESSRGQGLRIERNVIDAKFHLLTDVKDVASRGARRMAQTIRYVLERALKQSKVVRDLCRYRQAYRSSSTSDRSFGHSSILSGGYWKVKGGACDGA